MRTSVVVLWLAGTLSVFGVEPFPYTVATPAVSNDPAGKHPDSCLVITVRSVATVPGTVGGRRIFCQQKETADGIEVTPMTVGEPFVGKPRQPATVPERWLMFDVRRLNLAPGKTYKVVLNFDGTREELALRYDDATGLQVAPVQAKFFDAKVDAGQPTHGTPFRQHWAKYGDTEYCVSNLSLAAWRGGQWLWQVPISKWFAGYGYPPESVAVEGGEIILRTRVPKPGMAEPTEAFVARFRSSDGAFIGATDRKQEAAVLKQGDPKVKEQLERSGEHQ